MEGVGGMKVEEGNVKLYYLYVCVDMEVMSSGGLSRN